MPKLKSENRIAQTLQGYEPLNEQMMNKKVLNEATLTLTRLNNALKRVNHEMFGVCILCEEEINVERMLVRPESVRCVVCAS